MSKTTIPTTGSWVGYRPPQSGPVPIFSARFGAPGDAGAEVRVSVGEINRSKRTDQIYRGSAWPAPVSILRAACPAN
jgi:hypothetical protein